jgi:hypothetical protein
MLFAFVGPRLASLRFLDPLPIARGKMATALLLPNLLALVVGYGAGFAVASLGTSRVEYVNFQEGDAGFEVTVPLRVYSVAGGEDPPPVTSPWGETHQPKPLRPCRAIPVFVHAPFSAPPGSSSRFAALQISRAVEAVYGASIPPDEIEARYLSTREDGTVAPNGEGLTLRVDYPELRARSGPLSPVLLTLAAVPWLLLTAALLRAYRACVGNWVRHTIHWGFLGILLVFWIGLSVSTVTRFMMPWAIRGLVEIPVMRLGDSGGGIAAVWVGCGVAVGAAYWVAQSQFRRMEIPAKPCKYTLVEWMKGEAAE